MNLINLMNFINYSLPASFSVFIFQFTDFQSGHSFTQVLG